MKLNYEELATLYEIRKILDSDYSLNLKLQNVLNVLKNRLNMNNGIITVVDEEQSLTNVEVVYSGNIKPGDVIFKFGEGITGNVAKNKTPAIIPDISKESSFLGKTVNRDKIEGVSFVCVPIKRRDYVVGTLSIDYEAKKYKRPLDSILEILLEVGSLLFSTIENIKLANENERLKHFIFDKNENNTRIIGNSDVMKELFLQIYQVAPTNSTVLITGESGTGKELVAREIQQLSPRKEKPFIAINCGAIPPNLIESELFGYVKGAFTGAEKTTKGKIESANGGTLFLDEIGELPLDAQTRLLRVIENRVVEKVGSVDIIPVDVRIIAATNKDLQKEVEKGTFRLDLFYRLNVFPVHIPPLRERGSDIILISNYFISKYNSVLNKSVKRIDTPALDMLMMYHWPGNVRELQNTIERAMILSVNDVIVANNLPPSLQTKNIESSLTKKRGGTLEQLLDSYEKNLVVQALKDTFGNQTKAAELLGTTKRVIQYAVTKHKIDYKKFKKKK